MTRSWLWEPLSCVESLGVPGEDLGWMNKDRQGAGAVALQRPAEVISASPLQPCHTECQP